MLSGEATNTNFVVFGLTRSVYNSESTDLHCFKVLLPLFTVCLDVRMVSLLQSTSATTQIEI